MSIPGALRSDLVRIALEWERAFANAPSITTAISEYDAAMLVGMSEADYAAAMKGSTAVQRGYDFQHQGRKYQVKGTRPSGKPGSVITNVPSARNYDWDYLVWVSYDTGYEIQEAWMWDVAAYRAAFEHVKRLSPTDLRKGQPLVGAPL